MYIYIYTFSNFAEMNIFLYGVVITHACDRSWPVRQNNDQGIWSFDEDGSICVKPGKVWWRVGKAYFGRLMQYDKCNMKELWWWYMI